jgi:hypothetical protein
MEIGGLDFADPDAGPKHRLGSIRVNVRGMPAPENTNHTKEQNCMNTNQRTIRSTLIVSSLIAAALGSGSAHAVLQGRNMDGNPLTFEAYYDTVLNITWLADANYAKTSGFDADGAMSWIEANTWATNLSFANSLTNQTYADWHLPSVNPIGGISFNYSVSYNGSTDTGYNISEQGTAFAGSTDNEMAHLFYNTLDNKSYCPVSTDCSPQPQAGWGLTNTGPFTNLQAGIYWSATDTATTSGAWHFNFKTGDQIANPWYHDFYALAVSPGDIAAVPEAQTYALMLAGLGLIGWRVGRRG